MYSIGELIDRLVIENIKIFFMRQKIKENLSDEEHVKLFNKMNALNKNRATITNLLDEKIDKVVSKKEKNRILEIIKTYD
jgi:hypothetical protein